MVVIISIGGKVRAYCDICHKLLTITHVSRAQVMVPHYRMLCCDCAKDQGCETSDVACHYEFEDEELDVEYYNALRRWNI